MNTKSNLKSATKPFNVLLACTHPLITELSDKLRLKHSLAAYNIPLPHNATWGNTQYEVSDEARDGSLNE